MSTAAGHRLFFFNSLPLFQNILWSFLVIQMTAYTSTSYDSRIYCQMTMTTRKYATRAPPFHTYLSLAPIPSIDLSEDFFCDVKVTDDVGSGTSSSYVNNSEHYDNAYLNTYDNPIGCLDSVSSTVTMI